MHALLPLRLIELEERGVGNYDSETWNDEQYTIRQSVECDKRSGDSKWTI